MGIAKRRKERAQKLICDTKGHKICEYVVEPFSCPHKNNPPYWHCHTCGIDLQSTEEVEQLNKAWQALANFDPTKPEL